MSGEILGAQLLVLLALLLYGLAGYWAFSVARALVVPVYRSRAIGLGVIAVAQGLMGIIEIVSSISLRLSGVSIFLNPVFIGIDYFTYLVVFYWIDRTMTVLTRSDPRRRDVFHWRYLRFVILGLMAVGIAATPGAYLGGQLAPHGEQPLVFLSAFTIAVTEVPGLAYLAVGGKRSLDGSVRRHLRWLVSYLLLELVVALAIPTLTLDPEIALALLYLGGVGQAFMLYKAARSLVPLGRVP